jgi:hypothetical protein
MSTNKRDFEQHEAEIKAGRDQQARAEKATLDKEKQCMLELQKQPVDSPIIEYSEDEDEGDIEQEDDAIQLPSMFSLVVHRHQIDARGKIRFASGRAGTGPYFQEPKQLRYRSQDWRC